jgi:hypothetical protein
MVMFGLTVCFTTNLSFGNVWLIRQHNFFTFRLSGLNSFWDESLAWP